MDAKYILLGLLVLALAVYLSALEIAKALIKLRISAVDIRLPAEINVVHRGEHESR